MAKKRASVKGKGLGLSEEKGRGIDALFGASSSEEEAATQAGDTDAANLVIDATPESASRSTPPVEESEVVQAPPPPPAATPPPPPPILETMPAAAASDAQAFGGQEVDEFGLPVASETPPPDLELASSVLAETPAPDEAPPSDLDLSGIDLADLAPIPETPTATSDLADMPIAAESPPPEEMPPVAIDPAFEESPPDDLGLPLDLDNDLPDTMGEGDLDSTTMAPPDPITDDNSLTGLEPEVPGGVSGSVNPPPIDLNLPGDIGYIPPEQPYVSPQPPVNPPIDTSPTPAPVTYGPAIPTPPMMPVPRARVESIGGFATDRIQVVEKDILPEDTKYGGGPVGSVLAITDQGPVEQNELITQRVSRYIGRERRENLDKRIESLYDKVAQELSVNKEDAANALKLLSKAQDIIFEDVRQYDQALYRVKVVEWMIARRQNLWKWSYTWGLAVFFYAVVWLGAFVAGFLATGVIGAALEASGGISEGTNAVTAAWFSALAGGIGGVCGILYSLYWKVAIKQDFDRQYVMYYWVQPIMGFILGAVMYFIIGAGFLVINFASTPDAGVGATTASVLSSQVVIALQIVTGWIAGFRTRFTLELVDKVVQRFTGKGEGNVGNASQENDIPAELLNNDNVATVKVVAE